MQLQKNTAILNGILGTLKAPVAEQKQSPSVFQAALITAIGTMRLGIFKYQNKRLTRGGQ